jgi:predicted nucleic acid-binding protein
MSVASEPIVVNTGPLIALTACQSLDLLRSFHDPVLVPETVVGELREGARKLASAALLFDLPPWITVCSLATEPSLLLREYLDPGESAVITLALERTVRRALIDERRGRRVAATFGLQVTGSVAILVRAKLAGLIDAIGPRIVAMQEHGYWLSTRLRANALRDAGE